MLSEGEVPFPHHTGSCQKCIINASITLLWAPADRRLPPPCITLLQSKHYSAICAHNVCILAAQFDRVSTCRHLRYSWAECVTRYDSAVGNSQCDVHSNDRGKRVNCESIARSVGPTPFCNWINLSEFEKTVVPSLGHSLYHNRNFVVAAIAVPYQESILEQLRKSFHYQNQDCVKTTKNCFNSSHVESTSSLPSLAEIPT